MRRILTGLAILLAGCQQATLQQPSSPNAPTAAWVYRAPQASDDTGNVYATNAAGNTITVSCGNAGIATLSFAPDPRPADLRWIEKAVLFVSVDGGPARQLPATCSASGCAQDFMLGGEPFPISQIKRIVADLRKGSSASISLNGKVIQTYSLAGSSKALGAYADAQGRYCDGL